MKVFFSFSFSFFSFLSHNTLFFSSSFSFIHHRLLFLPSSLYKLPPTMSDKEAAPTASKTQTAESGGPAAAAGQREQRSPGDAPAADESKQRLSAAQDLSGVEAPAGASVPGSRDLCEQVEEAKMAQERPYEPQSTTPKPK